MTLTRTGGVLEGFGLLAVLLIAASCDQDARPKVARADIELERVSIPASVVTVGFAAGRLRHDAKLNHYEISKAPVTTAEYQACTQAGACEPGGLVAVKQGDVDVDVSHDAAILAAPEAAIAFCAWTGGSLPSLEQWLLAARGSSVQRFSWGDTVGNCEQHPSGVFLPKSVQASAADSPLNTRQLAPCANSTTRRLRVGLHPGGASRSGVEACPIS